MWRKNLPRVGSIIGFMSLQHNEGKVANSQLSVGPVGQRALLLCLYRVVSGLWQPKTKRLPRESHNFKISSMSLQKAAKWGFHFYIFSPILINFSIFVLSTYHVTIASQECGEFTNWSICLIWSTFIKSNGTKSQVFQICIRGGWNVEGGGHHQSFLIY